MIKREDSLHGVQLLLNSDIYTWQSDVDVLLFLYAITEFNASLDVVKLFLKKLTEKHNGLSDLKLGILPSLCVLTERIDILWYIDESIERIDVNFCLQVAELSNKGEMIAYLRHMQ